MKDPDTLITIQRKHILSEILKPTGPSIYPFPVPQVPPACPIPVPQGSTLSILTSPKLPLPTQSMEVPLLCYWRPFFSQSRFT